MITHEVCFKYVLLIGIIGMAVFPCFRPIPADATQYYFGVGMALLALLNLDVKGPVQPSHPTITTIDHQGH